MLGQKAKKYNRLIHIRDLKSVVLFAWKKIILTRAEQWIPLSKGDVQIIRAGNGISHAEELDKNSEIFQIWFDPNLENSLKNSASVMITVFPQFKIKTKNNGSSTTIIKGEGSPM